MNVMLKASSLLSRTKSVTGLKQLSLSFKYAGKSCLVKSRGNLYSSFPQALSQRVVSFKGRILSNIQNFSSQPWRVQNRRRNWGSNNPLFEGDNVIYGVIGTNVAVFGAWAYFKYDSYWTRFMRKHFTVSSKGVMKDYLFHTLLTASFSHSDPWHLLANMVTFYFFGRNVLSQIGGPRFAVLYIGGGLVSAISQVAWPYFSDKMSKWTSALGASGAVAAVVTWSILKAPMQPILLFLVIPVPAGLLGAGFLLMELNHVFNGLPFQSSGTHLGGVAFGALFFAAKK